ncbi:MAG: site-specific tyrosine recombinase/integron integrase [Spirochaetota bacterium]
MNDELFNECKQSFYEYMVHVRYVSAHTVKAYMHDVKLYGSYLQERGIPLEAAVFEDARRFVAKLHRKHYREKSINRIISAIKSFYKYCITYEFINSSPFSDVKSMKQGLHLPSVLTREEVERIIEAPKENVAGFRDRSIFSILYSTGSRLTELLQMDVKDIDLNGGRILVHGKGSRDRFVFLTGRARNNLEMYLPLRAEMMRHLDSSQCDPEALFVNNRGKRLTPQGVHYIFHTYVRMLGIDKHVTPHTFRHTFATHMLDNDAGIRVVQELLGHRNVSTTQLYSHVSTKRLKDVYKKSHPHGRNSI